MIKGEGEKNYNARFILSDKKETDLYKPQLNCEEWKHTVMSLRQLVE